MNEEIVHRLFQVLSNALEGKRPAEPLTDLSTVTPSKNPMSSRHFEPTKDVVNGAYQRRKKFLENIRHVPDGEVVDWSFPWIGFVVITIVGACLAVILYAASK